jgi:hypothetical protein
LSFGPYSRRLALVALLVCGCGRSEEAQEASRVARAIDVVRDAPNDPVEGRKQLLEKLEAEPAKGQIAIAARDACVRAYRPFVDGQELEARVRAQLAGPPDQIDAGVVLQLADAETKLNEAKAAMPDCDRALHDLKHKFR